VPILAVSLELYDDKTHTANNRVLQKQWFDETPGTFGAMVRGKRVLIVDEVDDTRTTLQFAVEELIRCNGPAEVAVLVVHNKLKPKKGVLPDSVVYIAGEHVPDAWNCCPSPPNANSQEYTPMHLPSCVQAGRPQCILRLLLDHIALSIILGTHVVRM
jgi:hypoxanthine phosphoribosyltransferase